MTVPDQPRRGTAQDAEFVRAALSDAVEDLPHVPDLVGTMHRRAGRIRRRRRATAAGGAALAALTVAGITLLLPDAGPSPAPPTPAVSVPVPADDRTRPAPRPSVSTPPAEHTSAPTRSAAGDQPSRAPTTPWGEPAVDEAFSSGPDLDAWVPYQGPSGVPETTWSLGQLGAGAGALRLGVDRVRASSPVADGAGVRADGIGAHRYGRWEVRWRMTAGPGVTGQFLFLGEGPGGISHAATLDPAAGTLNLADERSDASTDVPLDATAWHALAIEITPAGVRWLLDGDVVADLPGAAPSVPVTAALQAMMSGPDCGATPLPAGCPAAATFPARLEVDRVRFWPRP